ncbi:hypothetical protein MCOR17_000925 [Pyricularia oryzae]|nr:hypothetical protein MCOR17_000925 [Pyricularia oryzae]
MRPICKSMDLIALSTSVGHPSGLGSTRIHAPSTCSPAYATWRGITSHHWVCARQIVLQKGYPQPSGTWTRRQKGAQRLLYQDVVHVRDQLQERLGDLTELLSDCLRLGIQPGELWWRAGSERRL